MKNMKKLLSSLFLFMFIVTFSFSIFAANTATGTTTLELVDDKKCTISIDDFLNFEKKITKFNKKERSATLTLTVTNKKVSESTTKPVEIFLVIDNSSSMRKNKVGDITREQAVINSANKLVDKLFEANENAKIGVVSFSSLDKDKGETEGTINDAKKVLALSNSKTEIKSAISSIPTTNAGPRTNIEAGITVASDNYSSTANTNRYIVLLTDGLPNNDINGTFGTYSGTVATRTKAKLQDIEKNGVNIIGAMIGLNGETIETQTNKTYSALAEEVFGTVDNPTISSYYYIPSTQDEIETTIVNKIYSDIIVEKDNTLKNIKIKDYFPQEIINNFNFAHVTAPNIGKVTAKVDTTDNSITWTIPTLKEGETATLSYKLTLKDNYDKKIIDKVLPTNTKVDITGEDSDGKKYEKSSTDSPKVKVLYTEPQKDNTIANTIIPQTGEDTSIAFIVIVGIISIATIVRFIYLKRKMDM